MPLGAGRFGLLGGVADLGKLELIQTQTISSSTANMNFIDIKEDIYEVHLLQISNFSTTTSSDQFLEMRLSNDGGSSYESSNYLYSFQYGGTNGAFGDLKSASASEFDMLVGNASSTGSGNGYMYLYNLGNSSKYSHLTNHTFAINNAGIGYFHFGGYAYTVAETIDAIRLFPSGDNILSLTASLYGLAES
ncbi:MAG: hypothetical protein CL498_03560 [Actinobacteria bacterium]|nr:hypothetical protein [Actinomycetota bacterium]|tara:strand:- start:551 stop:1123 length:573 start_codon:yes stop_codon:yes gene_type:complete